MNRTLRAQTEERQVFLKNLIIGILKDDKEREGRSISQILTKLRQRNTGFEYNRIIVGALLEQLEMAKVTFHRADDFFWDHGRGLCNQGDGLGKCLCCGDGIETENGLRRCPTCQ